jgi:hypothetical protein
VPTEARVEDGFGFGADGVEFAGTLVAGSGPSAETIAAAVWDAAPAGTPPASIAAAVVGHADFLAVKARTDTLAFTAGNLNAHVMGFDATLDAGDIPTAAEVASAVWDEAQAGHVAAGTFGRYLDASVGGVSTGGVAAGEIASAVWDAAPAGTPLAAVAEAIRDVNIAAPAPDSLGAAVAAIRVDTGAVKLKTDNLPASPAAVGSNMGTVTSVTGAVGSVTAPVTAGTVNDKIGYHLGATGLDAIPMTLNASPSNFREWFVWLTLRFRRTKRNKATGMISVYGTDGTTVVTTQTSTDTGAEQAVGAVQ